MVTDRLTKLFRGNDIENETSPVVRTGRRFVENHEATWFQRCVNRAFSSRTISFHRAQSSTRRDQSPATRKVASVKFQFEIRRVPVVNDTKWRRYIGERNSISCHVCITHTYVPVASYVNEAQRSQLVNEVWTPIIRWVIVQMEWVLLNIYQTVWSCIRRCILIDRRNRCSIVLTISQLLTKRETNASFSTVLYSILKCYSSIARRLLIFFTVTRWQIICYA